MQDELMSVLHEMALLDFADAHDRQQRSRERQLAARIFAARGNDNCHERAEDIGRTETE